MGYQKKFIEKDKDQLIMDYAFLNYLGMKVTKLYTKK